MNDKYVADNQIRDDLLEEDDPLAELARIVAGEEPYHPDEGVGAEEPASEVYQEPEHADAPSVDAFEASVEADPFYEQPREAETVGEVDEGLEAELLHELDNSFEPTGPVPDTGINDQAMEELAEAMEQASSEIESQLSPIDQVELEPEPVDPETTPELSFEEEMNAALVETLGAQPEPEPFVEEPQQIAEPVSDNIATAEMHSEPEPEASFDDELLAALDQELVGEVAPEPDQSPVTAVPQAEPEPDYTEIEQHAIEPDLQVEVVPEIPEEASMASDTSEDLGAAFATQFEQMMEVSSETEVTTAEVAQGSEDMLPPATEEVNADEFDMAATELDFEAAFAEELNTQLPEQPGWDEHDNQVADAAFAAEVVPAAAEAAVVAETAIGEGTEAYPHVPDPDFETDAPVVAQAETGGRNYAVAALVIALFAGVITAGYGFLGGGENSDGSVPLIKASSEPVKVKPEDPGGRVVANQDNPSYDRVAGNETGNVTQENLVSTTEEPAIIDTEALQAADAPEIATGLAPKSDDRLEGSSGETGSDATLSSTVKPRVVQVVTVKPDGTIVRTPVEKKTEPVEAPQRIASVEPSAISTEPTPVETQTITQPQSIDGAKTTNEIGVPIASPLPKPVEAPKPVVQAAAPKPVVQPTQPAANTSAPASEWVVQVSSQRSADAARQTFNNMRRRYAALQGRSMNVQQAEVNGATYYRVRVNTTSRADATQLCTSIANAGGNCFVTR